MVDESASLGQYQHAAARIDGLLSDLNSMPYPLVHERVLELLQNVDALHRTALGRLVGLLADSGYADLVDRLAADEVVRSLLSLYDLYPDEPRQQVEVALVDLRSILKARGGELQLLGVVDGVVRLRLSGSACCDCATARESLENAITQTLRDGFPDFKGIDLVSPVGQ